MSVVMQTKPTTTEAMIVRELDRLLVAFTLEHERLREVNRERRSALSRADHRALAACLAKENGVVQAIAALDRDRAALAALAARRLAPGDRAVEASRVTLTWIAERLPEPDGSRLRAAAAGLKEAVRTARQESASVAQAADVLARHMRGLIRAVEQRLAGAAAYTSAGGAGPVPPSLCALDCTT